MKKIYFLMLALVCAMTASALNTKNSNVYFDGTDWSNTCVQLMIGNDGYSQGLEMTKIANTNLYYILTPDWSNYTQLAIFGTSSLWGGEGNNITHRKAYADKSSAILENYELKEGEANLLTEGENSLVGAWLENGYESLNYAQKVEAGEGGSVEATSFALNSNNTTEATEGTEIKAALTATVSCVAAPAEGYLFDGWYSGEDKVAESAEYEYVCKAANTLTAKFKVDPATAIESVSVDANAPVEYYNLQGVKVANPENGLFIKKQGNKAVKVIL